jgi:hypothetical protein
VAEHLSSSVEGENLALDDSNLLELSDLAKIRQSYKVPNASKQKKSPETINGTSPSPTEIKTLERIVLGVMAIKGV